MAFDLLVKNGWIVDGTGLPAYFGDVAVKDGKIAEIGQVDSAASAAQVIDAEGQTVAPGFIDVHTHFDAQLTWDPIATSSCWHGITSIVITNCGFAVAPVKPEDRGYIMRMLAKVEGMALPSLERGLRWEWETYPEYLEALDQKFPLGLNVGSLFGHTTARRYVMGDAASERDATPDELESMKNLLREALRAGSLGFSTTQGGEHFDGEGRPVASRVAPDDELVELAAVLREMNIGCVETTPRGGLSGLTDHDYGMLRRLAFASGRPTVYNGVGHTWNYPTAWQKTLDLFAQTFREKGQLWGLAFADRLDNWFDLKATRLFFNDMPGFRDAIRRPYEEKLTVLADPNVRDRMRADLADPTPRLFSKNWADIIVDKPQSPEHQGLRGRSITEIAREQGKDPVDTFLDIALSERLETGFKVQGFTNGDPKAVAQIMQNPYVLPGVSDAGAHMDVLCFYGVPAMVIGKWHRETGVISLEEAVRRVTSLPAAVYGIPDRGAIREGLAADLVIFDKDRIRALEPRVAHDLPGGEMRLVQDAEGVIRSIVNGQVLVEEGRHTGNLPGRLIRNRKAQNGAANGA